MSSRTQPLAQAGSFTGITEAVNLDWNECTLIGNEVADVVTASGDAEHVIIHGLVVREIVVQGVINASGTYGFGQSSTLSPGINFHPFDWTLRVRYPLKDDTGSGDTEKNWTWGIPFIGLNARGVIKSNFSTGFNSNSVSVSTVLNQFGTVAGTLKLDGKRLAASFRQGASIDYSYNGRISGGVSYTGSTFSWLFPSPLAPLKGSITLDVDTDTNITNSALLYDFTVSGSAQRGASLRTVCRFRFDQAAA